MFLAHQTPLWALCVAFSADLERLRQTEKEAAPLTILWCEDADSAATADLIIDIKHVDDIGPYRQASHTNVGQVMTDAKIDGAIGRDMASIWNVRSIGCGDALAQSRTVDGVRRKHCVGPFIGNAS